MGGKLVYSGGIILGLVFSFLCGISPNTGYSQSLKLTDTLVNESHLFKKGDKVYYKVLKSNKPQAAYIDSISADSLYLSNDTVAIDTLYYLTPHHLVSAIYDKTLDITSHLLYYSIFTTSVVLGVATMFAVQSEVGILTAFYYAYLFYASWKIARLTRMGINARIGYRLRFCIKEYIPPASN